MKSHRTEFAPVDLLRIVGGPIAIAGIGAILLHAAAWTRLLPSPRPTSDTDRTILVHQVDAARLGSTADVVLIGDSSCLMDVSAVHLGEALGRSVLNLGTLSYLDSAAYGRILGEFTRRHAPRAVVLLMHPEALRRLESEAHQLTILNSYLANRDDSRPGSLQGAFNKYAGIDIATGRLTARLIPTPLRGAYGAYYGFSDDLEKFMTRHGGSALDPGSEKISGRAEFRLSPTLERSSREFRQAVPSSTKLLVGMTPVAAGVAPREFSTQRDDLLRQWAQWLKADGSLLELPAVLSDEQFARATHLKPTAVTNYTDRLAEVLRPHLP